MDPVTRRPPPRRGTRLVLLALAWCALTGHVFSGCKGLFTPAVPEPPKGEPIRVDYTSPERTLATMVAGMQAKGPGASAWLGAFSDEEGARYRQIFDAADFTAYQNACACQGPTEWGLAQENTFFLEFLNVRPSDTYVAEFDSVESNPDPPAGDSEALLYRRYQVFAFSADGNSTTIIAVGFANLTFTRLPTGWLITRWEDHVDPEIGAYPVNPDLLSLGRRRLESSR